MEQITKINDEMIKGVFESHGMNCNVICNGEILFEHMLNNYRVQQDEDAYEIGYNLLEKNKVGNLDNRFHLVKNFKGDNFIVDIIQYVKDKAII